MNRILIKDGLLVEADRTYHADLLIEDSKIARIEGHISVDEFGGDVDVVPADGLCVLPGLIDAQTHYQMACGEMVSADGFAQGSKAAAFGGVTTVIDFANQVQGKTLAIAAVRRIQAMAEEMAIDFALQQGVSSLGENLEQELKELKANGIGSVKIYATYQEVESQLESGHLPRLFQACRDLKLLITAHCEDESVLSATRDSYQGSFVPADHSQLKPVEAEVEAIKTLGALALKYQIPLYIAQISSQAGLEEVLRLRKAGAQLAIETSPHHLFLTQEKVDQMEGALYLMNPPLRSLSDTLALQEALLSGTLDVIASGHCAFKGQQKLSSSDCRTICPGLPGSEEMLPLLYSFGVAAGRMSISQLVNLLSTKPARLFGLYPRKGSLKIGSDADLVLFDSDVPWTIDSTTTHSASGYSAHEGTQVVGRAIMTYLRGRLIMGDGVYLGKEGQGKFISMATSSLYR